MKQQESSRGRFGTLIAKFKKKRKTFDGRKVKCSPYRFIACDLFYNLEAEQKFFLSNFS